MVDLNNAADLREAIELFYFAYRAFTSRADRILGHRGLGRVHHRILYFVGRNPDIPVGALLKILNVSKQALNVPLRQLIEMGLVTSRAADHDRRVRLLSLSQAGERLEAQLTGVQMKQLAGVFTALGQQDEAGWRRVMGALSERP